MKVLGVSGSPIKNSNTDRAVQAVLDATELETEFVKLSDYSLESCRACLGCLESNECVLDDDGDLLREKVLEADALVVGGFTPYSSLDARTKTFLERLYPGRHRLGAYRGMPAAAVITTAVPPRNEKLPPASETATSQLSFFFMEEGMENVGAVVVMGNVPCMKCGYGDECEMSAVQMLYGPDATTEKVGINRFEEQPGAVERTRELGRTMATKLAEGAR